MPQSSPTEWAIELLGITKRFPGVQALQDVSVRVQRAQIHALMGENGAGKSTLVKILVGVHPAGTYQGQIRVNGKDTQFRSPHDARLQGIGYVPQELTVIESLSVAENIFVGHLTESGFVVHTRALNARAERLLQDCKIDLDPRQRVATLSASERQLIMIARALSLNPSVLILDESTACLTLGEVRNLFRIVRHLRDRGVTIIFITHKMAELFELADCATVLRDGLVVAEFPRDAFTQQSIVSAMVGRKIDNIYPERDSQAREQEALRVEGLTVPSRHIAGKNDVDDVSFHVKAGEILGIAGLVGSGRSEIVNAIYGRIPCQGRIFVGGREVFIRNPKDALRHGIGLVTEERKTDGLLLNFSVRENLTLGSLNAITRFKVIDRQQENEVAQAFVRKLSIRTPSIATAVSNLSGGNQQKVVIGKVLMTEPKVLCLDEPTKGIDVGAKYDIYKLMLELVRYGVALILISSELPELLGLSDRLIVLHRGRLIEELQRCDATEERVIHAATGAREPNIVN